MSALLVVFCLFITACMVISLLYAVKVYKDHLQRKKEFDLKWQKTKENIERVNERLLRRSTSGGGSSSRTSNSSGSSAYDPNISMLNIASISDSGGYSGGSSCSSSSSYSSSSSSSSSSCD